MSSAASDVTVSPLANPSDARSVQKQDLLLPPAGNWSMRVEMAGSYVLPDGPVTVQYGASLLRGFVTRAGDDRGQYIGVIVGGTAQTALQGLDKLVTAQHYYQTPASTILAATLSQVGETLAADSTGLTALLDYPRRATRCYESLDEVADVLGLVWRVKLDGTVWFGNFTSWPATKTQFTYESKQPDVAAPLLMPAPQQPLVEPGQTIVLDGSASASPVDKIPQRVLCAHYFGDEKHSEARLWFQDPNADLVTDDKLAPDRVHAGIAALARSACRGTDWYRAFQGTIVTQRGDGTLDVNLDRVLGKSEMPPVRGAQVSSPVGGASLKPLPGDRVTVFFEGGDWRKPRCSVFENGTGTLGVARVSDTVGQAVGLSAWWPLVKTMAATFTADPLFATFGTPLQNALTALAAGQVVDPIGTITSGSADLKMRK